MQNRINPIRSQNVEESLVRNANFSRTLVSHPNKKKIRIRLEKEDPENPCSMRNRVVNISGKIGEMVSAEEANCRDLRLPSVKI